ncbi:MAG: hypothetical protein OEZ08_13075 [Betaproteobacteria bacterium]|nr:hypothetical protein [Betaproteobacteria bacterium]
MDSPGQQRSVWSDLVTAFLIMLSILPVPKRLKNLGWLKAVIRGVSAAVIGTLTVSSRCLKSRRTP